MVDQTAKRGRPKNTGRHQAGDAHLLPVIADRRLTNPHQALAIIIRDLIDAERDTGGVRRLQRAFKAQSDALMRSAADRRSQRQLQEVADQVMRFYKGVHEVRDMFVDKLYAWAATPDGQKAVALLDRFNQVANSPETLKWMSAANSGFLGRPRSGM